MAEASFQHSQPAQEARGEYARRLEQRQAEHSLRARQDIVLGNQRLAVAGAGVIIAWFAFHDGLFSGWWLLLPVGVFLALAVHHEKIVRLRDRAQRAVQFYENGIARIEDRWAGRGVTGRQFADEAHPYTSDLDIFGRGSLFELICTARTRVGETRLADWLKTGASPETIRARQAAVAELRTRLDLREDLAMLGEEAKAAVETDLLADWGRESSHLPPPAIRIAAGLLAACALAGLAAWGLGWGLLPLLIVLVVQRVFVFPLSGRVKRVVRAVDRPAQALDLLAELLARIEREPFTAPLLVRLQNTLQTDNIPPSQSIARLQTLFAYLEARRNQLFLPIGELLLWTVQFAFAIEAWRAKYGPHLSEWLEALSEFEALNALAGYAWEHPDDPFPTIAEDAICFEAEGLWHPLLPAAQAVANDIALNATARLFIVSGSNMSGKSTLLRAVGINAVLALAGAPVRARSLRLAPVHLGASLRPHDSLQAGISRFYAEILRLRQIVEIGSQNPPLLFLLDEILSGTNSHDRRVGAEAVVRALIGQGAIGLMTTHDLALARIAEDVGLSAVNIHFQDHLEDGKMRFDYRLRPGIVERSNAIALMRAVGLDV